MYSERVIVDSKLINGNSLEVLKDYDDNSVDLLCTDPPYGYGFMGKDWDQTLPPRKIFEECLRVLKPGSLAFVMSAPRSDVQYRMAQMLEEVGFNVSFTPIYWAYATGFPKAMNISNAVVKRGDTDEAKKLDGSYAGYQPKPAVEVVIVAMKPLEQKGYLDQALDNQKGITWLDDCRIPFEGMIDTEQYDKDNVGSQKNFDIGADGLSWGNQPVRKTTKSKPREENTVFKTSGFKSEDNDTAEASPLGRFAANLLVSDNVLDTGKKTKSTGGRAYQNTNEMFSGGWAYDEEGTGENPGKGDEGDFSRYYSLDEWWKSVLVKLNPEVQRTFPFLVVPKASKSEKNMGLDDFEKQQKIYNGQSPESSKDMKGVEKKFTTQPTKNNHPTVKPLQLFSYLVTLGSRKDDVVLDPFMGSGTTPISCVTLDRKYLGIEREKDYFEIAEARVEKAKNPANLVKHEFF